MDLLVALRDSTDELVVARQNQILASIYYDRHLNRSGPALSNVTDDIENAERHAKRAFNKRFKLSENDSLSNEELEKHILCIQLLIRILETLDKIPEADVLKDLLPSDGISIDTGRLTRKSTAPVGRWANGDRSEASCRARLSNHVQGSRTHRLRHHALLCQPEPAREVDGTYSSPKGQATRATQDFHHVATQ